MAKLHDKVILINIQKNLHDVSTCWVDDDVWTCWVDEGVVDSLKLLVTDADVSKW